MCKSATRDNAWSNLSVNYVIYDSLFLLRLAYVLILNFVVNIFLLDIKVILSRNSAELFKPNVGYVYA